ncbi:hypothetical protein FRB97_002832 [Tulasnella sp. 331]|nr:hypothetical protein FRB97_002832 [Tulasnella sp. 331]
MASQSTSPSQEAMAGPSSSSGPELASSGLLQVIPHTGFDVEEDAALYSEFQTSSPESATLELPRQGREATPSVFSHDIWLEDKTGEKTTFATDVKINGWTSVGDKKGAAYIDLNMGQEVQVLKRYSAFETLNDALRTALSSALHHHIPPLPTKNALAKYRSKFLDRRRQGLQAWLNAVLLHPEIGGHGLCKRWVLM